MKIISEKTLWNFEFWGGASSTFRMLTDREIELIDDILEELFPEGITETELNDIFWFDTDWIAEIVGYKNFEEMWQDRATKPITEFQ